MEKAGVSGEVALAEAIDALRTNLKTGFPQEHVGEQTAAHPNSAVNTPDRQIYALFVEGLFPCDHVLIDAIDQRTIQVEKENGLEASHGSSLNPAMLRR
jgi:hypothetical protein